MNLLKLHVFKNDHTTLVDDVTEQRKMWKILYNVNIVKSSSCRNFFVRNCKTCLSSLFIFLQAYTWVQSLLPRPVSHRHSRQAVSPNLRIRKEYRRLTDVERANFHRAVQLLKADTVYLKTNN